MTPPGWHQYSPTMACTLPRDASHLPLVPGGPGHSSRVRASRGRGTARPSVLSRDIKELSKCARNVPCLTSARRHVSGLRRIRGVSRPVGRVLCARLREAAVIHLGLPLPTASCGLPASIGRAALDRSRREPLVPLLTLLRVGFTEPPGSLRALVVSYTTVSPLPLAGLGPAKGGLLSVALSRGSPRVGVTDHPALWSPDLPHRACARRDRPADSPMLRIRRTPSARRS